MEKSIYINKEYLNKVLCENDKVVDKKRESSNLCFVSY